MEIFLDAPDLGELEKRKLNECIDSSFVSTVGPFVGEFAERFASYVGTPHAVPVQSGTAALHLALLELGVGPGDEVILPVLTFIATANAVMYTGATPVFADVDPYSWNVTADHIAEKITSRTRAIVVVHLYGNPCEMDSLLKLSRDHSIPIVEDATESLGATWRGNRTGTLGEIGCFSFNGNKVITTGGGGMITTASAKKAEHMLFMANQAREVSRGYYYSRVGYNYRMTNLEAALGLAQMERLETFLEKKRETARIYREQLENVEGIFFQSECHGASSSWWLSSVFVDRPGFKVEPFMEFLKAEGIPTRRVFSPITAFAPYSEYGSGTYSNAYRLFRQGLNLPSSTLNSQESVEYVARVIKAYLEGDERS